MAEKKKILLLSDDLRMTSGIATVSKEFVMGTLDKFHWVQLGAAVNHPEKGKEIDLGNDVRNESGVKDASLKIIPWTGYGNPDVLRQLIMRHNPDAILHFTDPRYWRWLYDIESEIRENIPILFYHIWDDLPDPKYNRDYYESCDWLGCISKQTYGIVSRVGKIDSETIEPLEDWQVDYVPHGINSKSFCKTEVPADFKKQILGDKDYKFVLFWMNRNIKRKQPSDVIWAYKMFVDGLPEEDRDKCCLVMHTQPIDNNGTNLFAVKDNICPDYDVKFSTQRIDTKQLNYLYNLSNVTINIAGNEGFGLTTAESIMAETPIIVNVTGGLQDQCGFKYKGKYLTADDYNWVHSLHDYEKWENNPDLTYGEWVKPVWPRTRALVGSPPTPYIFDDRCRWEEVAFKIKEWYDVGDDERRRCGEVGNEFVKSKDSMMTAEMMSKNFTDHMNTAFEKWKPKKQFNIYKV